MGRRSHDLGSIRFGRLIAISRAENGSRGKARWHCECMCGKTTEVYATDLLSEHTRSCGCLQIETRSINGKATGHMNCHAAHKSQTKHGHAGDRPSRTYRSWVAMKERCNNKNHKRWKDWGGRGISVCQSWQSFESFLADMGERPQGKTLDRYPDNDGDYEPANCRWATPKQQCGNRRMPS